MKPNQHPASLPKYERQPQKTEFYSNLYFLFKLLLNNQPFVYSVLYSELGWETNNLKFHVKLMEYDKKINKVISYYSAILCVNLPGKEQMQPTVLNAGRTHYTWHKVALILEI